MRLLPALAIATLLLTTGCSKEPSFEERFKEQGVEIQTRANEMQQDLTRELEASAAAERIGKERPIVNVAIVDE